MLRVEFPEVHLEPANRRHLERQHDLGLVGADGDRVAQSDGRRQAQLHTHVRQLDRRAQSARPRSEFRRAALELHVESGHRDQPVADACRHVDPARAVVTEDDLVFTVLRQTHAFA